ncbi:AAA family ATPase [Legionella nagasakiensis]|uniref:AAA family ATPase n=1 Tax=Legionella nagasakiensis TaxID=535290 RepID=UPI001055141E|nr:AAA family ATPase [Legionella nagasakiensis]
MNEGTVRHAKESPEAHTHLFKPLSWVTKIDFINQLILGTNVMISVLGEPGGGKSSFIELLQASLDKRIRTFSIAATALFDQAILLSYLQQSLGVQEGTTLSELIEKNKKNQVHTLVIIDDAQYLSESFVDELLNALQQQGPQGYLHFCLVADRSVTLLLNKLESKYKDMIHSIELGPLSECETKAYVKHRLLSHPEFITDELVKQFHQLTEGKIVGINTQMPSFFNVIKSINSKKMYNNKSYTRLTMVAGAVFIALGIAFVLQSNRTALTSSPESMTEVVLPLQAQKSVQLEEILASKILPYDVAASRQFLQPAQLRRAELIISNEEETSPTDNFVVMDKVVVIPKVIQAKAERAKTIEAKAHRVQQLEAPAKQEKPALENMASVQEHYTIQLIASHDRTKLEHFARLHHITKQSRILRAQKSSGVWYVLTFGDYNQREVAKQAIAKLPQELAKLKPWVRPLSDLRNIG